MKQHSFKTAKRLLKQEEKTLAQYEAGNLALTKTQLSDVYKAIHDLKDTIPKVCPHEHCQMLRWNNSLRDEYDSWHDNYRVGIKCHDCGDTLLETSDGYGYSLYRKIGSQTDIVPLVDLAEAWDKITNGRDDSKNRTLRTYGIHTKITVVKEFVPVQKRTFVSITT